MILKYLNRGLKTKPMSRIQIYKQVTSTNLFGIQDRIKRETKIKLKVKPKKK